MMPRQSLAEKYREHNREMKLALELGITPGEARAMIDGACQRDKARERWEQAKQHIADRECVTRAKPAQEVRLRDLPDEPWMMRE